MTELTTKQFARAYAKRWAKVKKSPTWPSRPLVQSWCEAWAKENPPLARLVDEPLAGSGKIWKINPAALEIEPGKFNRRSK